MNQRNIGQSNTSSVKVNHGPGGKSNWSFGWSQDEPKPVVKNQVPVQNQVQNQSQGFKYHNESHFQMNDGIENIEDEEKKREEERRKKEEQINSKLPSYNPKNGNKTNIFFGDDKTDYRRKDEITTSVKIHNPPGGRSNIQFG